MIFKKIENTRKDFGFLFDYLLEKHFSKGYFKSETNFKNCINAVNNYNLEFNRGSLIPLEDLLVDDKFISTYNYEVLIQNLVEGLFYIPMHNLKWEILNQIVAENFLFDHIFEHLDLPHYYILHNDTPTLSFCLVDKISGNYFPYRMFEVLPSKFLNTINGRFDDEHFEEFLHYSLEFDIEETLNERLKINNKKKVAIKDFITIPQSEYASCINIDILSSIIPEGTNVPCENILLNNIKDIEFRDNLLALMNKKNIHELPF